MTSPPSLWDGVKRNVGVADSLFPHAQYWCWYENTKIQEQPELLTFHSLQLVGYLYCLADAPGCSAKLSQPGTSQSLKCFFFLPLFGPWDLQSLQAGNGLFICSFENHWVFRICGTKQNRSMWKIDVVCDWKFTKLYVSTILVVSLAPEANSTLTTHMLVFFLCMQVSFGGSCCRLQGQFQTYTKTDMPLWSQWWKPWSCVADVVCVQFCFHFER